MPKINDLQSADLQSADLQSADLLYDLCANRTTEALDEWVANSDSEETRRLKKWLIFGFYCTRETDLIGFAQAQKGEAPHVAAR